MKRFFQKPYLVAFGIIGLILVLFLLRQFGPLHPPKKEVEKETPIFEEENLVSASGKIEAKRIANLTFQTSGLLSWVGVKEGDYVQKWQGIASLDRRELEKRLARYLNLYMTNRWDFEQLQEDYKDEKERYLITQAMKRILDKAQFSLNNAVIDVELTDLALKLSTISTPIEGIVTRVDTPNPGINVTPLGATFTVIDPSSVYFSAFVDEADISKIKIGQEAKITLDSYPDEEFKGRVERIDFVATTTTGGGTAFRVEISLPENDNLKFKVGANGDAEILVK